MFGKEVECSLQENLSTVNTPIIIRSCPLEGIRYFYGTRNKISQGRKGFEHQKRNSPNVCSSNKFYAHFGGEGKRQPPNFVCNQWLQQQIVTWDKPHKILSLTVNKHIFSGATMFSFSSFEPTSRLAVMSDQWSMALWHQLSKTAKLVRGWQSSGRIRDLWHMKSPLELMLFPYNSFILAAGVTPYKFHNKCGWIHT